MKKYIIAALCACAACSWAVADTHKSNSKNSPYGKEAVKVPMVAKMASKQGPQSVAITAPEKQLYGEWTILSVNRIDIDTDERAYIYLDFNNGNQVYGCNGCNAINGRFTLKGNNLSFSQMIQGGAECNSITDESEVMNALAEVAKMDLESVYGINYMVLKNARGQEVMRLRQLNFDLLNGPWLVKEIDGVNVLDKEIQMVIDIDMRTLHALTKCHIIRGKVHIDALKENDVQFEDLKAYNTDCEDSEIETQLLIKLEETVSCKKAGNVSSDMELVNNEGETVIRLQKTTLTRKNR
ncbi:MAG: META domain-containing protein [Sodaliphilus sp.]